MDRQDALNRLRSLQDLERCLSHPQCQLSDCDKGMILIVILEARRVCEELARGCCGGNCPEPRSMSPWCQRCPPSCCESPPNCNEPRGQQQKYMFGRLQGNDHQQQQQQNHRPSNYGKFPGRRGPMDQRDSRMDFGRGFDHNRETQEYKCDQRAHHDFGGDYRGSMNGNFNSGGFGSQYNERMHQLESNISLVSLHRDQGMDVQQRFGGNQEEQYHYGGQGEANNRRSQTSFHH